MTQTQEMLKVPAPRAALASAARHINSLAHTAAQGCQDVEEYFDFQENLHRTTKDFRRTDLLVAGVYLATCALVLALGAGGYYLLHHGFHIWR